MNRRSFIQSTLGLMLGSLVITKSKKKFNYKWVSIHDALDKHPEMWSDKSDFECYMHLKTKLKFDNPSSNGRIDNIGIPEGY